MEKREHLSFRIDSLTPDTLPMARLAQYLAQLSILYGNNDSVHFDRLRKGSAILQVSVMEAAYPKVMQRLRQVGGADAEPDVKKAFHAIDRLLRADHSAATITHGGTAKILEFPGRKVERVKPTIVHQPTTVDGVVIRIGGRDDAIPVALRDAEGVVINCEIRGRDQAKELSRYFLAETLRVSGNGKWSRASGGKWVLESLVIQTFEVLDDANLGDIVEALRSVTNNGWADLDDPLGAWKKLRGVDDHL
ncbi:hypothetical protein LFL96_17835 [Paraburkholderia sp. D15]|uniref:hypothetical protein n=1 Tax=Paraburkholderia sp. D15 TaxID=2880218 RepID=UPI00247AAB89|nr:hypothetical protein [Paraburkholderia sp. D15]WGS49592.1 hypothetical protein LFL96_17835 [Paraburkholderia sp. D15]